MTAQCEFDAPPPRQQIFHPPPLTFSG